MPDERAYRDDEVREIFALAARPIDGSAPARPGALTLGELQEIGREVGLDPGDVARAAAALDARGTALPARTSLGMPVGVGRIVPLPRAPSDEEWERLVAELRATFGARGRVSAQGGMREWANGKLHACVERGDGGYRLRLGTLKTNAQPVNAAGTIGILGGGAVFTILAATGGLPENIFLPMMLMAGGAAAFVGNFLRLPRWADERSRQMEHIAERARVIVAPEPDAGEA